MEIGGRGLRLSVRQALLGSLTWRIVLDLAALLGFTLVTLWLVGRKMIGGRTSLTKENCL